MLLLATYYAHLEIFDQTHTHISIRLQLKVDNTVGFSCHSDACIMSVYTMGRYFKW